MVTSFKRSHACTATLYTICNFQCKLEVVKQEMAKVNVDILGIRELKWTGMGEFNSEDHYVQCQPYSRPPLTHTSARDSWTLMGKSGSISCVVTVPFSWVLVHTRFCLCPSRDSFLPSPVEVLIKSHGLSKSNSYNTHQVKHKLGFPGGSVVKNLPAMQKMPEIQVRSLGREKPLEEGMATHTNILAWKISWTEKLGGLQSIALQRVRYD